MRVSRQLDHSALRAQTKRNLRQLGVYVYLELTQKQLEYRARCARAHVHRIVVRHARF
jgi:hypothetical protein